MCWLRRCATIESMIQAAQRLAPWPDYAGNAILLGAVMQHPSGEQFTVIFDAEKEAESLTYGWRALYGDGMNLWLGNQIGPKGMAVLSQK